jgi:hypothetical protein
MRFNKSLLCGISALTLATGAAFAGEDSTHRWHGTGSEYHQDGGLLLFGEADAVGSEQFSEPNIDPATTSISYYEETYYLIPMETLVLIPSEDSELPPLG